MTHLVHFIKDVSSTTPAKFAYEIKLKTFHHSLVRVCSVRHADRRESEDAGWPTSSLNVSHCVEFISGRIW